MVCCSEYTTFELLRNCGAAVVIVGHDVVIVFMVIGVFENEIICSGWETAF